MHKHKNEMFQKVHHNWDTQWKDSQWFCSQNDWACRFYQCQLYVATHCLLICNMFCHLWGSSLMRELLRTLAQPLTLLESISRYILCSSHLKLTMTALHCRHIKTIEQKDKFCTQHVFIKRFRHLPQAGQVWCGGQSLADFGQHTKSYINWGPTSAKLFEDDINLWIYKMLYFNHGLNVSTSRATSAHSMYL